MVLPGTIWSFQVLNKVLYLWQPEAPKKVLWSTFFLRVYMYVQIAILFTDYYTKFCHIKSVKKLGNAIMKICKKVTDTFAKESARIFWNSPNILHNVLWQTTKKRNLQEVYLKHSKESHSKYPARSIWKSFRRIRMKFKSSTFFW